MNEARALRIYLASSWRNAELVRATASFLRTCGFSVDDFTDTRTDREGGERFVFDRYVFNAAEVNLDKCDAVEFLRSKEVQQAFQQDKVGLDWADACVLILPAGRSSHLEAGYAVGRGKKLVIFGEFHPGEYDTMYGFADLLTSDPNELNAFLKTCKPHVSEYAALKQLARSYLYGVDAYESMRRTGADAVEINECAYMLDRARDGLHAALGLSPAEQGGDSA